MGKNTEKPTVKNWHVYLDSLAYDSCQEIENCPIENHISSRDQARTFSRKLLEDKYGIQENGVIEKIPGRIVIFTDGSFSGNHRGGFSWIDEKGRAFFNPLYVDNNNEAEFAAIAHAIASIPSSEFYSLKEIIICSDSLNAAGLMRKLIKEGDYSTLTANELKTTKPGSSFMTKTFIRLERNKEVKVRILWVKGHGHSVHNKIADLLAGSGMKLYSEPDN